MWFVRDVFDAEMLLRVALFPALCNAHINAYPFVRNHIQGAASICQPISRRIINNSSARQRILNASITLTPWTLGGANIKDVRLHTFGRARRV